MDALACPPVQRLAPGWLPDSGLRLLASTGLTAAPATAAAASATTAAADAAVHGSRRGMADHAAEDPSPLPVSTQAGAAGAAGEEREGLLGDDEEEERVAAGYTRLPSTPAPTPSAGEPGACPATGIV